MFNYILESMSYVDIFNNRGNFLERLTIMANVIVAAEMCAHGGDGTKKF